MRVVSWNMGMAHHSRGQPGLHDQAWHYLLGLGPDLALLQETLPPGWVRNEGTLVCGPFKQSGSAIFSPRFPIERFLLPSKSVLRPLGAYLAYGVASLPDGTDALVGSAHAVDRQATRVHLAGLDPATIARPSVKRPRINDVVFAGLEELARERTPFIFGGDWNTGRSQSNKKAGEEFFSRARDSAWYDCVWEKRGEEVRTWFREGDLIIQNDHVFCDKALGSRLTAVSAAGDAVTELGLSDHAPLILDFDIAPISMTSFDKH
jgi:hypothetical protein